MVFSVFYLRLICDFLILRWHHSDSLRRCVLWSLLRRVKQGLPCNTIFIQWALISKLFMWIQKAKAFTWSSLHPSFALMSFQCKFTVKLCHSSLYIINWNNTNWCSINSYVDLCLYRWCFKSSQTFSSLFVSLTAYIYIHRLSFSRRFWTLLARGQYFSSSTGCLYSLCYGTSYLHCLLSIEQEIIGMF